MKLRFLSLLLIIAGNIIVSGCVDKEAHPSYKDPENMDRSIFYPYTDQDKESIHNLRDATSHLDRNIEKAERISNRVEERIQHYKQEGKDVSKLEILLEKYNLSLKEAKKYRALADAADYEENSSSISNSGVENSFSENTSSENTRIEYLIKSQKNMMETNVVLKEIFNEFQRMKPGSAELNSTSKLYASGNGIVTLFGNFTLNLHLEEGELTISHLSPDSVTNITGNYVFEENDEIEERDEVWDNVREYEINSADINISGSEKTVQLRGINITLNASNGDGTAIFLGNGTYIIDNAGTIKEHKWADLSFKKERKHHHKHGHNDDN
jgi:hypothetical protein